MAGIFVRGLTGNKVNVFVDGARYSTARSAGGVNTFLNLIDPSALEAVEVLRGPEQRPVRQRRDRRQRPVPHPHAPASRRRGDELHGTYSVGGGQRRRGLRRQPDHDVRRRRARRSCGTLAGRRVNTLRAGRGHRLAQRASRASSASTRSRARRRPPARHRASPSTAAMLQGATGRPTRATALVGELHAQPAGRRQALRPAPRRRRQPDRRPAQPDARPGLGQVRALGAGRSSTRCRSATRSTPSARSASTRAATATRAPPSTTSTRRRASTALQAAARARRRRRHALPLGGDFYHEQVTAPSFALQPGHGRRAPCGAAACPTARATTAAASSCRTCFEAVPGRLRLVGNLRWSAASYEASAADSPLVNGQPLWPDDSQDFSSLTFRAGAVLTAAPGWTLLGEREPRLPRAAHHRPRHARPHRLRLRGVARRAGRPAARPSAPRPTPPRSPPASPADTLEPETSLSYEAAVRFRRGGFDTRPGRLRQRHRRQHPEAGADPAAGRRRLAARRPGDRPRRRPAAPCSCRCPPGPVLVNANFDDARIWGIEHTLEIRPRRGLSARRPSSPTSTPRTTARSSRRTSRAARPRPTAGCASAGRRRGSRFWVEPYVHAAARQDRLSILDLEDRRTGAGRSRTSIAASSTTARARAGWSGNGPDGVAGTADDVLLADRRDAAADPGPRAGHRRLVVALHRGPGLRHVQRARRLRLAPGHELLVDLENIGDRNYRGISWGDGRPGPHSRSATWASSSSSDAPLRLSKGLAARSESFRFPRHPDRVAAPVPVGLVSALVDESVNEVSSEPAVERNGDASPSGGRVRRGSSACSRGCLGPRVARMTPCAPPERDRIPER